MGLETVLEEISKEGYEKIEKVKKETELEVKKIISNAEEKAKEIIEKAKSEAEREALLLRKRLLSGVRLELKREELRRKQEIFDEVFKKFKEKVKNMDEKTKREILEYLISKYEREGYIIYSRKEDKELVEKLTNMKYAGEINCLGGIIIEKEDGTHRINLVFDEIVKELYERRIKDVHRILFE